MVTLPEEGEPLEKGEKSFLGEGASLEKGHCCKAALAKAKAADEIPVDSRGVPLIFCTPDKAGSSSSRPKPFINRREGAMVHGHSSQALQKALGYGTTEPAAALAKGKVPAKTLPKPLQKGKARATMPLQRPLEKGRVTKLLPRPLQKGKARARRPLQRPLQKGKGVAKPLQRPLEKGKLLQRPLQKGKRGPSKGSEGPWYALRKTNAKKPKRTYITGVLAPGSGHPRKLIVEVPATWSSQHDLICNKIMKALEKDSLSKAEALKMREELVAAYP